MPHFIEKVDKFTLDVIPLRGIVVFPLMPISFELSDEKQASLCEIANKEEKKLFFVAQKDMGTEKPALDDLYKVGTVAGIKQYLKMPDGTVRVVVEGICRGTFSASVPITAPSDGKEPPPAEKRKDEISGKIDVIGKVVHVQDNGGIKGEGLAREALSVFDSFVKFLPKISGELLIAVKSIKDPGLLADFIAGHILINYTDKQQILEEYDPLKRLELLAVIMERELEVMNVEMQIHKKVRAQIDGSQREYYLREQLKVIQNELNAGNDGDNEIDEYYDKIYAINPPKEVSDKLLREVRKLSKTPLNSAESGVIKNYLDVCLELPWNKLTKDRVDIDAASKILERDHDGLEKIKERILEFLAVKQLNPEIKNQVLCLVGPPGTGKTSIVASIARSMRRKYVRVSLGGVRDEADIRGHRKTYIGAMPGRIITALRQAGTRNPIILLDEIDKLTRDAHGDPSSALLEVLDTEQNKSFRDHFIELPIDLSDCIFIATANTIDTVPRPLIDRMEVIELKIYTRHEKLAIAKNHLLTKQAKRHGLNKRTLKINDAALFEVIDFYTREAGVRGLEREIANICRKAAKIIVQTGAKNCVVTAENLHEYLGRRKVKPEKISASDDVGVVNGLAYTELGGDLLRIEVSAMPGTGKIELTGSLGDVMKESARAAISYIRAHAEKLNIDPDFYKTKDLHIHVPEGAVPKDGPSAGVTILTALASELSGRPIRRDVAMTGEITLRGNVLAIGGLKEKTMAAYKAGVHTVLIPADNADDLEDIDPLVRGELDFVPCATAEQILERAIINAAAPASVETGAVGADAVETETVENDAVDPSLINLFPGIAETGIRQDAARP